MGEIRVVLIFNEDNERQREIGRYLKSQKRCKTALITELVYAWLHKENAPVSSYNNANVSVLLLVTRRKNNIRNIGVTPIKNSL